MADHQILIVGGGAAGISCASSLLNRDSTLDVAIIEPCEEHYYQPGWTMVGGGIFTKEQTVKPMAKVWPKNVKQINAAAKAFLPDSNEVELENGDKVSYEYLIAAPGLKLNWDGIEGLSDALGKNGVTSNYRYDLAPYTWDLVRATKSGNAIFTCPPMPIKCAGAPQKAMYLSADYWLRDHRLGAMNITFATATPGLFGAADYVPPLMEYIKKYDIDLAFQNTLVKVDGPNKIATFEVTDGDGNKSTVERPYDMLHVVPPQCGLDFVVGSPLANAGGWIDVDQHTLQHVKYPNVFSLGDACSTPNAKTAAAVRKQAPIVAENLLAVMNGVEIPFKYDGYGSCPLTVEHGKIILAEFGYGGKLLPSFNWDSTKPRRSAWILKKSILPYVYWKGMLRGKEWMVKPKAE